VAWLQSIRSAFARPRASLAPSGGRDGWTPILVREPTIGAWQRNEEITVDSALNHPAVFACTSLIASDIGKVRLRLVAEDSDGVWTDTQSPAFSPVLRKPNRYQTILTFIEQWMTSKLVHGNTYALKERDGAGLVRAMYVLDPTRVTPLISPDGGVYYELRRDDLVGLGALGDGRVVVPASEIFHDKCVPLFHPLIGTSPLYACGLSALQGLTMQQTSNKFFAGGANPGGVLTAPGAIADDTAKRLKEYWDQNFTGDNVGKVAVLGDGLHYEPMTVTAADSKLIEQLNWTAETICSCFHVPAFMIGVGPPPPFANVEPMLQQYHAQCIQSHLTSAEQVLDDGLGLDGTKYGTEFDVDDLIWMDTATKTKAAADAIGSGAMAPNEARKKYFGLGSVKGGDTPYMQQQNYSLSALDERDQDQPFSKPTAAPAAAAPEAAPPELVAGARLESVALALLQKDWSAVANG